MRKSGFYPRLALTGILRGGQFYYPYLLTCMGTAAMFYIMLFLAGNSMIQKMPGAGSLKFLMELGCAVIAIFSVYILFYANNFVMKRRRRELGLYHILGLEKRHIARLLACESLILGSVSIAGGLALGILFSKLILLLLLKMLRFTVPMGFSVSGAGALWTAVLFAGIFVATLLTNLFRIGVAKPVELLHSEDVGEREPKTKKLLTAVGVVTLAAGYIMANTVKNPLQALALFFVAVILVIVGTECLFTAGSIAVLKRLRANRKYYYQPKHFVAVSGMIYRMKQNAKGLANICILCTMVLVTVSTSVCLYLGLTDSMNNLYPADVCVSFRDNTGLAAPEDVRKTVEQTAVSAGRKLKNVRDQKVLSFAGKLAGHSLKKWKGSYMNSSMQEICVVTAKEYQRQTGKFAVLRPDEVLAYSSKEQLPDTFTFGGETWKIKQRMNAAPVFSGGGTSITDRQYLVVADDTAMGKWMSGCGYSYVGYEFYADMDGTDAQKIKCVDQIRKALNGTANADSRQSMEKELFAAYGGFLFLGLFLGVLFLLVTTLIIYYKQVSEGYQDRRRFEIMQQVGMSRREVRQSIQTQILMVFFLPLVVAGIHVFGAFHMISKMLALFALTNIKLFALCTLGTLGAFAVIYALVYLGTAQTYYRIVRMPETE